MDNNKETSLVKGDFKGSIKDTNMMDKDKVLEILYKIFYDFYAKLLQDYHAHEFFQSYYAINSLIKKQSEALYNILNDIRQKNLSNVVKDLEKIAERHWLLGINHKVMFESIELYANLLREYKENLGLEEVDILTVKEILEQATAKNYIKGILRSVFDLFVDGKFRFYSKYDEFFQQFIIEKLESILSLLEDVYKHDYTDNHGNSSHDTVFSIGSHIECKEGKLLHGIGFDIMTFGNKKLKIETIAEHKLNHSYINQLISYYKSKDYSKAVSIAENLANSIYKTIYNYQIVSKNWEENKEKLLPEIFKSEEKIDKLFLITIFPSEEISKNNELIINSLRDILMKYSTDFDFLYFTESNNVIYIFVNLDKLYSYKEKYENLLKDLESLSKNLSSEILELGQKTIFYVYKLEPEDLLELTKEEVRELINILKEEANKKLKEWGVPFVFVNLNERKYELLQKVKEEISIKKAVLEKVNSKDIDIFIHWIFDANLNKKFFEILARIKRGDEYIPAFKFINILERENKMIDLDIAVITNVMKNIDKIKALTNEFYLNIYPPSLSNESVVKLLKELIALCNEKDIILNLELTEYAITTQKDIIEELSHHKFYLAFDDFGTGYTNYELVGELVDIGIAKTLKVDGYIVRKLLESDVYASIVEAITIFSKRINLRIIYEFVDNENLIKALKDIAESIRFPKDRLFFQGFYLHKPNSLEEEYLASQNLKTK